MTRSTPTLRRLRHTRGGGPRPAGLWPVVALMAGCSPSGSPSTSPPAPAPAPVSFAEPAPIEPGMAAGAETPYAPGIDVLHYDVEVGVSDASPEMAGRADITVRTTTAAPALPLDFTGLAVRSVAVAGRPATGTTYRDGVLRVPLRGAAAGDTVVVRVEYGGTPDDGLFIGPHVHGAPSAFADNWPNRTRFWLPTVDHPSDKATVRFTVHAPAAWEVVANGYLVRPPSATPSTALGPAAGSRRTWMWHTTVPIPTYTMVVGAAEMVVRSVGRAACGNAPASQEADGCVDVTWWAFPRDTANAARIFRRAADMTDYYTDLIGPFPYEKLANVQSGTRFGGMENSSAIFYTGEGLATGRLSEGTVAHEIAHQWFGDSATEARWSHLWLSEGFATYFGALYFEHADGVDEFRGRLEQARQTYLASDDVDRPVVYEYDQLFGLLNRNSYQKGGWVLHMLRGVMGDDAFFEGIRRYYRLHEHGTALTADFQAAMEEVHGESLEWFFQQWIFQPGYPVFEVSHRWLAGSGRVEVVVGQTQKAEWPTFRTPLTLELRSADGRTRRHQVRVDERRETFLLESGGAPEAVVVDPDGWILKGAAR